MIDIFSLDDKIEILKKNGYKIKKESRKAFKNAYHNDFIEYDQMMWIVYKNGKEVKSDYNIRRSVSTGYHVNQVFEKIYKEKITKLLVNNSI